jgi:GNAT superfamily N-acetyltransferase
VPAEQQHLSSLVELLAEMDHFYGATELEPVGSRLAQVRDALFGDVPAGAALLAWCDDALVGFAAYSFLWPAAGVTRSVYLKELYVAESARRLGVGTLLMRQLHEVAQKCGCSRVEWTTDGDNVGARQFYAKLGAAVNDGKLFYRVEL